TAVGRGEGVLGGRLGLLGHLGAGGGRGVVTSVGRGGRAGVVGRDGGGVGVAAPGEEGAGEKRGKEGGGGSAAHEGSWVGGLVGTTSMPGHLTYGGVVRIDLHTHTRHSDGTDTPRSEEHTSELQSRENLVCRLL